MSRILFWSAADDGSSWYRCEQPAESLTWRGHETVVNELMTSRTVSNADALIGSRIALDGPTQLWQHIARAPRGSRPKLVLDLDDAYFSVPEDNTAFSFWGLPENTRRLAENIRVSDLVTVASEGIAEDVIRGVYGLGHAIRDDHIQVVPNGLHAGLLGWPADYDLENHDRITIGWAGTASTAAGFPMIGRALAKILLTHPNVDVRLVGMHQNHPALASLVKALGPVPLEPHRLMSVDWVHHGQPYLSTVAAFDIWVAPYVSGVPFNEAKFPTKALESSFLGIPLVASAIRPYAEWITHEVNGFLVPSFVDHLWLSTLRRLVTDASLRRRIGEAARSRAAQNINQSLALVWEQVALG